jgi:signal transduction histidine kinase
VIVGIVRWQLRRSHSKNAQLENLVTARTRELRERETELVRAMEGADAANRAKSIFLANMSHELRTPLNAILGYTQILLKDDGLSEKNRERLTVVGQSGTHLLTLINEVLDLAKIEAGKLTLNPAPFAFDRLLADICSAFRQPVQEKGLEFACTFAPGLPAVINSDAGKLRQVLFNLLSNALKFTKRGRVVFKVTETAEGMIGSR